MNDFLDDALRIAAVMFAATAVVLVVFGIPALVVTWLVTR